MGLRHPRHPSQTGAARHGGMAMQPPSAAAAERARRRSRPPASTGAGPACRPPEALRRRRRGGARPPIRQIDGAIQLTIQPLEHPSARAAPNGGCDPATHPTWPATRPKMLPLSISSGTGKTHLLIGLGLAACEQGRRVRYVTTAAAGQRARRSRRRTNAVPRRRPLRPPGPALLDELGYVQIDPRGAELLFQIITEREERASIAIATNLPFSEWGTIFPDPRWSPPIVDRVTFNAHIIETGTQSYRLRTSKTTSRPQKPKHAKAMTHRGQEFAATISGAKPLDETH